MPVVTLEEAQARLPELIDQLACGGPLIITRGDRAVAQLLPPLVAKPQAVPGRGRGKVIILSEDDEHLKDFGDYMP